MVRFRQQCETLFKEIAASYPLHTATQSYGTVLLFPQFQLLLCMAAFESNRVKFADRLVRASTKARFNEHAKEKDEFARKTVELADTNLGDLLAEFLRKLGIDKTEKPSSFFSPSISTIQAPAPPPKPVEPIRPHSPDGDGMSSGLLSPVESPSPDAQLSSAAKLSSNNLATSSAASEMDLALNSVNTFAAGMMNPSMSNTNLGTVTLPLPCTHPKDNLFESSLNSTVHSRQAMLMRMEHLLGEVESEMISLLGAGSDVLAILAQPSEENTELRPKATSKPVVIADAVAFPEDCADSIEQLLEAALAHHNLGSYEEALKFLEATRIQLIDIQKRKVAGENIPTAMMMNVLDVELFIISCKGNVYQSCGDDEQAMLQYLDGWNKSKNAHNYDWEIVFLNAVGMLAYYNLRFDVGLMCFSVVTKFRASVCFCRDFAFSCLLDINRVNRFDRIMEMNRPTQQQLPTMKPVASSAYIAKRRREYGSNERGIFFA
jgi:hypothetical protein